MLYRGAEVREIYREQYWNAGNCHHRRSKLDLAHFDTAANVGIGRATRILREAALRMAGSVRQLSRHAIPASWTTPGGCPHIDR
ncbi:MAG: glycosyl hydrolase 108 family protein [Hyphomicrobium sp.]